jgi:Mrp family chromosome partitioning ATPase
MVPNLLFILRRRWPILLLLPIATVVATLVLAPKSKPAPPKYTTRAYIQADPSQIGTVDLQQAAVDMRQNTVASAAARRMNEHPSNLKVFASQISVKVDATALSLQVSSVDPQRQRVQDLTAAFAESFVADQSEQVNKNFLSTKAELERKAKAADNDLNEFLLANGPALARLDPKAVTTERLLEARVTAAQDAVLSHEADTPKVPFKLAGTDPVSLVSSSKLQLPDSRPLRAVLAWMLGFLGAMALTGIIEKLNPRVDNPKQAEAIVGAPVLAMVPVMRGKRAKLIHRADLDHFSGPFAESFRAMRSHLDFRSTAEEMERPPCVMVVSSAPAEGKTTTAAFLGLSYAEVGRDVVVVGADFRRPAIHRLFGVARTPGLSSRLLGEDPNMAPEAVVNTIVKRDERTGVRVIPSGPGTDRVTGLLGDLAVVTKAGLQSGCTVLIDTAPIMVANDAIDFLPLVDWVVVVVRLGKSTERTVRQTIQNLELNNAAVAGVVLVGSLESSDAKRYYYSYYRSENESRSTTEQHLRAARERRQADIAKARRAEEGASEPATDDPGDVAGATDGAGAGGEPVGRDRPTT